jgi:hypothetical protein
LRITATKLRASLHTAFAHPHTAFIHHRITAFIDVVLLLLLCSL